MNGRPLQVNGSTIFILAALAKSLPETGNILAIGENNYDAAIYKTEQNVNTDILPADIRDIYTACCEAETENMRPEAQSLISDITDMIRVSADREALPFDCHRFRPMTDDKIEKIKDLYYNSVRELWQGYLNHYQTR